MKRIYLALLLIHPVIVFGQTPQWIWLDRAEKTETVYFRKFVELPAGKIKSAKLQATCDNGFSIFVNGNSALAGDNWNNKYGSDIAKLLTPGHVITVEGRNQGGKGLYRIDVSSEDAKVEKLEIDITSAQGLLQAFGSLWVNVNGRGSGVYRFTDTNGDGKYDKKETIMPLAGGGEHGPHALVLGPDGINRQHLQAVFQDSHQTRKVRIHLHLSRSRPHHVGHAGGGIGKLR